MRACRVITGKEKIMNGSLFRRAAAGAVVGCAALLATVVVPSHAQAASAAKPVSQQAGSTYIANGQELSPLYKPGCTVKFACSLSFHDFLYRMHWTQWSTTKAVGTGTYLVNGCTPNCAKGTFYSVPIVVTFTNPVKACQGKAARWYWTKATFRFTHGLPPVLRHLDLPNPFSFPGVAVAARATCRG
jgi:hypothetical protein